MEYLDDTLNRVADEYLVGSTVTSLTSVLAEGREAGRRGWYSPLCNGDELKKRAMENLKNGDWEDALALTAMLLVRELEGLG